MLFFNVQKKLWLLLPLLLFPAILSAQVRQDWVERYDGPSQSIDEVKDMVIDAQGNVYVTGTSVDDAQEEDYLTIKYDSKGLVQWIARYNGPGDRYDIPQAIAVDSQGNVYVTGGSYSEEFDSDYATIKYDAAGNQLWVARYDGIAPEEDYDTAKALAVDAQGNVYVTGYSGGTRNGADYVTIMYNAAGEQQWLSRYNGPANAFDAATALLLDANGNVVVTGESNGIGTYGDITTVLYTASGEEVWVARYNYPGDSYETAANMALDANGNIYITGWSRSADLELENPVMDYITIKYNNSGQEQWSQTYHHIGDDSGQALAVDAQGNVFVTGHSDNKEHILKDEYDSEWATIKYNSQGVEQWVTRYTLGPNTISFANSIALDAEGNAYVTGLSSSNVDFGDITTIKYDASTGTAAWIMKYNGPSSSTDMGIAVKVDEAGNVYVAGNSFTNGSSYDFVTIKYTQQSLTAVCKGKGEKVMICHKGKMICISAKALAAHLKHGDQLGACTTKEKAEKVSVQGISELSAEDRDVFMMSLYPNPATHRVQLAYELPQDGRVIILVYDWQGRQVATALDGSVKAGRHTLDYSTTKLQQGLYSFKIMTETAEGTLQQTKKLMLIR